MGTSENPDPFRDLIGEELSGVTFVRNYLQLQFNPPPTLNAYTPVTVVSGEQRAVFGEPSFANLLIGQIGKVVKVVTLREGAEFEIAFADGSRIAISLLPEHYVGPEAMYLIGKDRRWGVM